MTAWLLPAAVALLLTLAGLASIGPVFSLLGATPELMPMITDRRKAEEEVRRLNEDLKRHAEMLEQRVEERTAELVIAKEQAESAVNALKEQDAVVEVV